MVRKRCLIGLQKGVNKTSKGHLLEAKRALIRVQLSLKKIEAVKNIYKEVGNYGMICLNRKSIIAYYEIIHNDRLGF